MMRIEEQTLIKVACSTRALGDFEAVIMINVDDKDRPKLVVDGLPLVRSVDVDLSKDDVEKINHTTGIILRHYLRG